MHLDSAIGYLEETIGDGFPRITSDKIILVDLSVGPLRLPRFPPSGALPDFRSELVHSEVVYRSEAAATLPESKTSCFFKGPQDLNHASRYWAFEGLLFCDGLSGGAPVIRGTSKLGQNHSSRCHPGNQEFQAKHCH